MKSEKIATVQIKRHGHSASPEVFPHISERM